jgi:hypothetical protein
MLVNFIIHDFKQIFRAIKAQAEILVFHILYRAVITAVKKSIIAYSGFLFQTRLCKFQTWGLSVAFYGSYKPFSPEEPPLRVRYVTALRTFAQGVKLDGLARYTAIPSSIMASSSSLAASMTGGGSTKKDKSGCNAGRL